MQSYFHVFYSYFLKKIFSLSNSFKLFQYVLFFQTFKFFCKQKFIANFFNFFQMFLQEKNSWQIFSLLRSTPPTKCFPWKFATKPCCKFMYCILVFYSSCLTDKPSITLFLLLHVALHSLKKSSVFYKKRLYFFHRKNIFEKQFFCFKEFVIQK